MKAVCVDPCAGNTSCGHVAIQIALLRLHLPLPRIRALVMVIVVSVEIPVVITAAGGGGNPDPCAGNSNRGECGNGPCDACFVAGTKVSLPERDSKKY